MENTVKVLIAGGRDLVDYEFMSKHIWEFCNAPVYDDSWIEGVSGMARGADALGKYILEERGVLVHQFKPDWDKFGKSAGFLRNEDMGRFCDVALIFWDGKSKGTEHMINFMAKLQKPMTVIRY